MEVMSKRKKHMFTQGPWRVFGDCQIGNGKQWVASCYSEEVGFGRSEDAHNAALIAKLPELLEAAEDVIESMCVEGQCRRLMRGGDCMLGDLPCPIKRLREVVEEVREE